MADFFCKNCGFKATSVAFLTGHPCSNHSLGPNKGKCELYEGGQKKQYTCKYCGFKSASIAGLAYHPCTRHPKGANKGKCSPAL